MVFSSVAAHSHGVRWRGPAASPPRGRATARAHANSPTPPCATSAGPTPAPDPAPPPSAALTASFPCSRRGLVVAAATAAAATLPPAAATPAQAARPRSAADPLTSLEDRVSEFTLPSGLHFIVLERHKAPIVSCHTLANVGAYDEPPGQTGIAHLLEHLAFKGTRRIGTRDYATEAALLDLMDEAFYEAQEERRPRRQRELAARLEALQGEAQRLWVPNEFGSILTRNGGVGLNASTSHDSTQYYVSLPSNKLELWFALESERFRDPVFRELYSEKEVVQEERLQRIENARLGKFQERFALESLWAGGNPYGRPVIGFQEDVNALGRREVEAFFRERYQPERLTITVVGDVTPDAVQTLAAKYFGPWQPPAHATRPSVPAAWPRPGGAAGGGGGLRVSDPAGPYLMEGYYRPDGLHPDAPALDMLSDVLSGGRTARFFDRLVVPGRALSAGCLAAYPSDRRSSMLLTYGVPAPGEGPEAPAAAVRWGLLTLAEAPFGADAHCPPHPPLEALAEAVRGELRALAEAPVEPRELARIKKAQRAGLLEALGSNMTMATLLGRAHVVAGTWRDVLADLDRVEAVGAADVQRAAGKYLGEGNRFSGMVDKK